MCIGRYLPAPTKTSLAFRLLRTFLGTAELRTDRSGELCEWATARIRSASLASGFDLLVGSHVGFRCLRVQLGSGNLPLVPLGESLVHNQQYNIRRIQQGRTVHLPAGVPGPTELGFISTRRLNRAASSRAYVGGDPACQLNARRQKAPSSEAGGCTAVRTWRRATISDFVPCSVRTNVVRRDMQRHSAHSSVLWCRKIGMWLIPIC